MDVDEDAVEEFDEDYFDDEEITEAQGPKLHPVRRWCAYWMIPKVKFLFHALASLAIMVMLMLILLGPDIRKDRDGVLSANMFRQEPAWLTWVEIIFWVTYVGRVAEEVHQLAGGLNAYITNFWNKVDLLLFACNSISFVLRMQLLFSDLGSDEMGDDSKRQNRELSLNQTQFEFQVRVPCAARGPCAAARRRGLPLETASSRGRPTLRPLPRARAPCRCWVSFSSRFATSRSSPTSSRWARSSSSSRR